MNFLTISENNINQQFEIKVVLEFKEITEEKGALNTFVLIDSIKGSLKEQFENFTQSHYPDATININTRIGVVIATDNQQLAKDLSLTLINFSKQSDEIYEKSIKYENKLIIENLKKVIDSYFSYELLQIELNNRQQIIGSKKRAKI